MPAPSLSATHAMVLQRVEKPLITLVFWKAEGHTHQVHAAHLLGINRNTLRKKIKEPRIRGRSEIMGKGREEEEIGVNSFEFKSF